MSARAVKLCGTILLLLCFLPTALPAQGPSKPGALAKHSLWKLVGEHNTVYLLGSIHLLKKENFPLPEVIEAAFRNSQVVVFETDFAKLEEPETQQFLVQKAQLPPGETLRKQVSLATYVRLSEHLQRAGLPSDMFDHLKPSLAAITIEALALKKLGFDPEYGLDLYFFKRAQKQGKEIVPLETVEFQIDLITQFSPGKGELLLKATLDDIDSTRQEFGEMVRAWETGDAAALEKLINQGLRETPALLKRLVTDRNRQWLPRIEGMLRGDKDTIVIVGAGHLVGRECLVELLRKSGLSLEQE